MRTGIVRGGVLGVAAIAVLVSGVAAAPALALKDVRVELLNNTGHTLEIRAGYIKTTPRSERASTYEPHLYAPRVLESQRAAEFNVGRAELLLSIGGCTELFYDNPTIGYPSIKIGSTVRIGDGGFKGEYDESFAEGEEHTANVFGNRFILKRVEDADGYKNFKTTVEHCS